MIDLYVIGGQKKKGAFSKNKWHVYQLAWSCGKILQTAVARFVPSTPRHRRHYRKKTRPFCSRPAHSWVTHFTSAHRPNRWSSRFRGNVRWVQYRFGRLANARNLPTRISIYNLRNHELRWEHNLEEHRKSAAFSIHLVATEVTDRVGDRADGSRPCRS